MYKKTFSLIVTSRSVSKVEYQIILNKNKIKPFYFEYCLGQKSKRKLELKWQLKNGYVKRCVVLIYCTENLQKWLSRVSRRELMIFKMDKDIEKEALVAHVGKGLL